MDPSPDPKRFYWLKRLVLAALMLVVVLVGLRLYWGHAVQTRLDQAIADIHAKGEPILFSDLTRLQQETPSDQENGAWYLMEALNQWPSVPGQPGVTIHGTDWYLEGEEAGYTDPITDNLAYIQSCQPVLDLIREADTLEDAAWHTTLTRPLLYALLPHLGNTRRLARLVDDVAYRALDAGDTDLVFETMLLQHAIARHVHGQPTVLIDSLVAISIMAMDRDFIEKALPKIDPADLRQGPARDKAKEVIARLTDDMLREGFIQAFIGERAASYDVSECLIDGTETAANLLYSGGPITWVIDTPGLSHAYRPSLKNEQLEMLRFNNEYIQALKSNTPYSDYQNIGMEFERKFTRQPWRYPVASIVVSIYGSCIRTYYRSEALLHCAATAIAIKLYQADHDGQRPDSLAQLVPEYLPAIPIDPFSPTGEPIRYNPVGVMPKILDEQWLSDEQRTQLALRPYPLLYSVGEDGIDDQGAGLYLNPEGDLNDSERYPSPADGESGDIWFMLDPWPEAVFEESDLVGDQDPYSYDSDF